MIEVRYLRTRRQHVRTRRQHVRTRRQFIFKKRRICAVFSILYSLNTLYQERGAAAAEKHAAAAAPVKTVINSTADL